MVPTERRTDSPAAPAAPLPVPAGAGPEQRLPPVHFDWIDRLKFIGMIFIVLGHTHGINELLEDYFYSFHVPLFFFVSGFLLSGRTVGLPHRDFIKKSCGALLIPYLAFGTVSYAAWYFVFRHFGENAVLAVDPVRPLVGMLYGVAGTVEDRWYQHNAALWFFPCLFVTQIYTRAVVRAFPLAVAAAVNAAAAAATHGLLALSAARLPWGAEVAMIAAVFAFAGYAVRVGGWTIDRLPPAVLRATIVLALALQALAVLVNGRVDVATGQFRDIPLFYLGAFAGIWIWAVIAIRLPDRRIGRYFGSNTLIIFPMHLPVFAVITGIFVFVLGFPADVSREGWASPVYTVACFLLLVPVIEIINRCFPWIAGRHRAGAGAARPAG